MSLFVNDPDFQLYVGDVTETLRGMADESVHCCVTSPPYWGLRDYGTGTWEGGDPGCDHTTGRHARNDGGRNGVDGFGGNANREGHADMGTLLYRDLCGKCGATRIDHQLGLEPTPEEYVARMVAVFREVRRVLRRDGTCWLNIGDSYNAAGREGHGTRIGAKQGTNRASATGADENRPSVDWLKPKDLVGIPWRLAFALQQDGWYLRSDIIWSKPNPMPESVTDRPTKAHEYLFLLSRSARYFYDADAIREDAQWRRWGTQDAGKYADQPSPARAMKSLSKQEILDKFGEVGRNKRSVWEIATESYPEAHFATFPQALVEPCIKAGCPEGGTVLDPFMGSGTTALVARRLGRKSIGIELNESYAELAAKRLSQLSLLTETEAA